jgi:cysteine sulfinate desulfinase/cysteine desulfurase-like protein
VGDGMKAKQIAQEARHDIDDAFVWSIHDPDQVVFTSITTEITVRQTSMPVPSGTMYK